MQISSFLMQLTGLTVFQLKDLVKIHDDNGTIVITAWNVPNVAQPSAADLLTAIAAPEPVIKPVLLSYASTAQQTLAAAGLTVNADPNASTPKNVFVSTDPTGLTYLGGAVQFAQLNPSATVAWVSQGGTVNLSAAEVIVIATAAYAYVQSTFGKLASVTAEINSGAITTEAEIDTAFAS